MTKIAYIHGFNSNENSKTFRDLKKFYPSLEFLSYDHEQPDLSILEISEKIQNDPEYKNGQYIVVASSLGGWYATKVANIVDVDLILYNPSLYPSTSITKYGVSEEVASKYSPYQEKQSSLSRVAIISQDDEVIDKDLATSLLESRYKIVETTGGHRMTDNNLLLLRDIIQELDGKISP